MKQIYCWFVFVFCCSSVAVAQTENVDTTGFFAELKKAQALLFQDALVSRDITYKWSTKLYTTSYVELQAQIELLHAINNQSLVSSDAANFILDNLLKYIANKNISPRVLAEIHARKGLILNELGESVDGISELFKAKKIYQDMADSLHVCWIDALQGACYTQQHKWEEAKESAKTAAIQLEKYPIDITHCDAYNFYVLAIFTQHDQATDYNNAKNLSTAEIQLGEQFAQKSLKTAQELNNRGYTALALKSCAYVAFCKNELDTAIQHLEQCIRLFEQTNLLYAKAEAETLLVQCYYAKKDTKKTIEIAQNALPTAIANGWFNIMHRLYRFLAVVNYTMGNYREGADYGGKSFVFGRYLSNSKRSLEMDAKIAEYEREKQEKLTEKTANELHEANRQKWFLGLAFGGAIFLLGLLGVFVFVIRNKNKTLKKLSNENLFLLGEANHRIKNNLQLISSLLAKEINKSNGYEINALTNMATKIGAIASLHQQLYVHKEKESISLDKYLNDVHQNLQPILHTHQIESQVALAPVTCSINTAVYIGLLMNELFMNSAKHAFDVHCTEKKIALSLQVTNNTIALHYTDNGRGIPKDKKPKLVYLLCRQLKADYDLQQTPNNCNFYINIPL